MKRVNSSRGRIRAYGSFLACVVSTALHAQSSQTIRPSDRQLATADVFTWILARGEEFAARGEWGKNRDAIAHALVLKPNDPNAEALLARAYFKLFNLDEAAAAANRALAGGAHNADAYQFLGLSLLLKRDFRTAAVRLRDAETNYPYYRRREVLYPLIIAEFNSGDYRAACRDAEEYIRLSGRSQPVAIFVLIIDNLALRSLPEVERAGLAIPVLPGTCDFWPCPLAQTVFHGEPLEKIPFNRPTRLEIMFAEAYKLTSDSFDGLKRKGADALVIYGAFDAVQGKLDEARAFIRKGAAVATSEPYLSLLEPASVVIDAALQKSAAETQAEASADRFIEGLLTPDTEEPEKLPVLPKASVVIETPLLEGARIVRGHVSNLRESDLQLTIDGQRQSAHPSIGRGNQFAFNLDTPLRLGSSIVVASGPDAQSDPVSVLHSQAPVTSSERLSAQYLISGATERTATDVRIDCFTLDHFLIESKQIPVIDGKFRAQISARSSAAQFYETTAFAEVYVTQDGKPISDYSLVRLGDPHSLGVYGGAPPSPVNSVEQTFDLLMGQEILGGRTRLEYHISTMAYGSEFRKPFWGHKGPDAENVRIRFSGTPFVKFAMENVPVGSPEHLDNLRWRTSANASIGAFGPITVDLFKWHFDESWNVLGLAPIAEAFFPLPTSISTPDKAVWTRGYYYGFRLGTTESAVCVEKHTHDARANRSSYRTDFLRPCGVSRLTSHIDVTWASQPDARQIRPYGWGIDAVLDIPFSPLSIHFIRRPILGTVESQIMLGVDLLKFRM